MTQTRTPINRYESAAAWREVDDYFSDILTPEDPDLVAARESGTDTSMPNAEIAPNQGALLGLLTQIADAHRVLEFGTLAGYSTIWFARAVGPDGHVVTLELEDENARVARANFERAGLADRIDVLVGPATHSAQQLVDANTQPFDLVFIDADKPNNPTYLDAALKLTTPGAIIIIDNVVRNGAVTQPNSGDPRVEGARAVTRDIAAHPDLDATAIQTVGIKGWDGLIVARRR
ncbi:O-methyltransferase [Gordonia sp. CPCC 206044]|uniref:O-methyltransferase n=1 Tax=Gordonia sp. CPCC 206044 TaxID=3140793 RepID=UPI003AF3EFAA